MLQPIRFLVSISICVLFYTPLVSYGQRSKKSSMLDHFSKQSDSLHYASFTGQPAPSTELLTLLGRQARWDDSAGALNPSGLHLRFEKIDGQTPQGGRETARYRIFAEGAPENKVFAFESWPLDKAITADPRDIYANLQGLLMVHRPKPEQEMSLKAGLDELEVSLTAESAEPLRFALSSVDGQLKVFSTLVPDPVVSEDKGCRLEVRVAQPNAAAVLVVADGFPAKAKITFVFESEGAAASEELYADADGHAVIANFPSVPGKAQGMLRATAEGPNCLPTVVMPWGASPHQAAKTP